MVLAGDLVPAGPTLVTPDIEGLLTDRSQKALRQYQYTITDLFAAK